MASVGEHYDNLLACHYTWMRGDYDAKVGEYRDLFERLGVSFEGSGVAPDLGAGPGFQSVALAGLGFDAVSVDLSDTLLEELRHHPGISGTNTVVGDIRDPTVYAPFAP